MSVFSFVDNHLVNYVFFVMDKSSSMKGKRAEQLIRATTDEIAYLARVSGSDEMNQETRVAFYTFADTAECVVSERDVMRLPSIRDVYHPGGNTALCSATLLALDDIEKIRKGLIYGKHAFLVYVLTDGEENWSPYTHRAELSRRLANLPSDVTVACLVPDGINWSGGTCFDDAIKHGFPRGNVAVWNTNASDGVEKAVQQTMRTATTNFMTARATGNFKSTTNLFSMGADTLNDATVKSNLTALSPDDYKLIPVTPPKGEQAKGKHGMWEIKEFAEHSGWAYAAGETGYYQFVYIKGVKPSEKVTPGKKIIIVEKSTGRAYSGPEARTLLGLSHDKTDRVKQQHNEKYDVYISSDSNNRHLPTGTKLLLWKPVPLKQRIK